MYSVKVELDRNNVCFGCLSSDRQLTLLKTHVSLFYKLLEYHQVYNTNILLCWECRTILDKIWKFQKRIQRAQFLLQQTFFTMQESWEKLSTLSYTKKDSYDHIICYNENKTKVPDNNEIPVELGNIIVENLNDTNVNVKEEEVDFFDDFKLENDYRSDDYETLADIKNSKDVYEHVMDNNYAVQPVKNNNDTDFPVKDNKDIDKDYKPPEKRIDTNPFEDYMDKVTVLNGDMDENDLKKYCVKVILNEKEIEEVLEKERNDMTRPSASIRHIYTYVCQHCEKGYRREIDYKRHLNLTHQSDRRQCGHCKKTPSKMTLEEHWMKYHNAFFRCTICEYTSQRGSLVINHINTAHVKKFVCIQCNDQSRSMKEFKRHYKKTHERLICDACGKSFIKKTSLETHYRRHHIPPKCEICNRTYAKYHYLENHNRLNHPELREAGRELAYCVECNKQFPSVYKYRRHLASAAVHTPPKLQIVPCPECGKVFSRKIRMVNHVMSVHRKDTKHRCDLCNKTFCSAYAAKTHKKCVHEKIQMPKNKFCDICGRGFSTNRILANHRRTHTGERPFACAHCAAAFAQRAALRAHARTQHRARADTAC